jgi:TctA family transporter
MLYHSDSRILVMSTILAVPINLCFSNQNSACTPMLVTVLLTIVALLMQSRFEE